MNQDRTGKETPGNIQYWLKNGALLLAILLLLISCVFVIRLTLLANRFDKKLQEISSTVRKTTDHVVEISGKINEIQENFQELKERVKDSIPLEAAEHAIESAIKMGKGLRERDAVLEPSGGREIEFLLSEIGRKELEYEISGKKRSPGYIRAKMIAKYKLYKGSLESAEDFIETAAAKSTLGRIYFVIDPGGKRRELAGWLRERLEEYRKKQ